MSTSKMSVPSAGQAASGGGSFLDEKLPEDILALPLFDQNGKVFTLGSLQGKYIVVANFLTSCQEICPMTTANMRTIGDGISKSTLKDSVKVIEISVDAGRDSAARLKSYFDLYQSQSFSLASGSESDLAKLWKYFGAPATKMSFTKAEQNSLPVDWMTGKPSEYDMSHPDLVLIIGPDQKWKWLDLGNPNPGKATIPAKLKAFLSEDGLNNLAKPQEPSWSASAVFSALTDLSGQTVK
jgi:protein SCO1/2